MFDGLMYYRCTTVRWRATTSSSRRPAIEPRCLTECFEALIHRQAHPYAGVRPLGYRTLFPTRGALHGACFQRVACAPPPVWPSYKQFRRLNDSDAPTQSPCGVRRGRPRLPPAPATPTSASGAVSEVSMRIKADSPLAFAPHPRPHIDLRPPSTLEPIRSRRSPLGPERHARCGVRRSMGTFEWRPGWIGQVSSVGRRGSHLLRLDLGLGLGAYDDRLNPDATRRRAQPSTALFFRSETCLPWLLSCVAYEEKT
ncbi:hypothetical protein GY45DRAFT_1081801 [Cubamyces sp. BRFM 1775]|nr:hypothetical protein GY45DRAFT_1081801 [Cubamyces sp. BRFM 1775]